MVWELVLGARVDIVAEEELQRAQTGFDVVLYRTGQCKEQARRCAVLVETEVRKVATIARIPGQPYSAWQI